MTSCQVLNVDSFISPIGSVDRSEIDRQQISCSALDHSDIRGLGTTGQWSAYSPFCL